MTDMVGKTNSVQDTAVEEKLACVVGSGDLAVYATPMMAALMEKAACELLSRFLEPGQTSVGVGLNIEHTSATPRDMQVSATAEITCVMGKRIDFVVTARDECGEIGHGTHTRIIVSSEKFQTKTDGKRGNSQ